MKQKYLHYELSAHNCTEGKFLKIIIELDSSCIIILKVAPLLISMLPLFKIVSVGKVYTTLSFPIFIILSQNTVTIGAHCCAETMPNFVLIPEQIQLKKYTFLQWLVAKLNLVLPNRLCTQNQLCYILEPRSVASKHACRHGHNLQPDSSTRALYKLVQTPCRAPCINIFFR